jgi:hypothetical protein
MHISRNYQRPFWRGFVHAALVVMYCCFISIIVFSLNSLYAGEITGLFAWTFSFFLVILSFAVISYLIFYDPLKKILHHHFKAGQVMLASTIGWLFVFLIVFLLGLVWSTVYYPLDGVASALGL